MYPAHQMADVRRVYSKSEVLSDASDWRGSESRAICLKYFLLM